MGKDNIGRDVLTFLAGNLLDPTPMNYRFGYLYLTRSSKVICEETDTYIENGMRMKQETIVEIMGKHASASDDPEERIAARDEAVELVDIVMRCFAGCAEPNCGALLWRFTSAKFTHERNVLPQAPVVELRHILTCFHEVLHADGTKLHCVGHRDRYRAVGNEPCPVCANLRT